MEDFLLKCGHEKKEMLDAVDLLHAETSHVYRIMDHPATGTINAIKLRNFLEDVDLQLEDGTIERMAEMISSTGEAEFTEDDLFVYVANNLNKNREGEEEGEEEEKAKKFM